MPHVADTALLTGPFFLGFTLEAFGMGIVLVMSLNFFIAVKRRERRQRVQEEAMGGSSDGNGDGKRGSGRGAVVLVAVCMGLNMAQTMADMYRGWNMFGTHFTDLGHFLTISPLLFFSPFLGLLLSTITQLFLLRRSMLFVTSLAHLWPTLAHPVVKWGFVAVLVSGIALSFGTGTMAVVIMCRTRQLWQLHAGDSSMFTTAQLVWLSTSTAVDLVLSVVLCGELWWARRKLSMQGGVMRVIVTRLILVTCNGGLAVAGLTLASLLLYNYSVGSAMCYFPITVLPKVYNITLILSISLPHQSHRSSLHVFTLPTVLDYPTGSLSPTLAHTLHTSGPIAGNAMSLHRRKRRRNDEAGNQKNSFETSKVFFERSRNVLSTLRLDFERVSKDREHTWPNYLSSSANKDLKQERRASEPASVVPLVSARASASSSTVISPQRDAHGKSSKYYLPKDHPLNHPVFVLSPPKRPEKVVGVERKHVFSGDWVKRRKRSGDVTSQIENESKEKSSLIENPRIYWEGESSPYALLSPSASSCSNPLSPSRRTTQTTGEWDSYRSGSGDLLFSKSPATSPGPDHLSTLFTNETVPSEGKTLSFAQMLNEKEDNLLERTTTLSSTYKPSNASRASFEIMFSGSTHTLPQRDS
nr:hypothetical protein L204_00874 [Cryptococcus depauperatus CBS 7855]